MAPEQIQGPSVTGAAVLWSLGVTLYATIDAGRYGLTDALWFVV